MGYAQVLPSGDYLVRGVQSSVRYPFIMARYRPNGTLVRQQTGRKIFGFVQDLVPLGTAGFLLTASIPEGSASNVASLFFQRMRPNGDTLLGHRYPSALFEGSPVRAIRDGDSVRVLAIAADRPTLSNQVAFLTTDTAGTIGRIRRYANPTLAITTAGDMVRTARGGWLAISDYAPVGMYGHPYLQELNAHGVLRRQRVHVLFASTSTGNELVVNILNNLIRLTDGSGYVFSGQQRAGALRWGFLCKLDTALNVVWTYRHPPQATVNLAPRQVYELPDGSLGWMASDEGAGSPTPQPYSNKLYYIRVSASGQLLGQRTFTSAACTELRLYNWQPLPHGGALVTGGYAACGTPGSLVTYTARLDSAATVLAERPGQASSGAALYPNPATAEAIWQGAVPAGAGAAELVLCDVLGRVVRRVAVAGRGEQVTQALELRGLAAGIYACRLLVAGQPVGPAQKLTYLP